MLILNYINIFGLDGYCVHKVYCTVIVSVGGTVGAPVARRFLLQSSTNIGKIIIN